MNIRGVLSELNIVEQAKKYGIPIWQYPQFLFLVMGIIIVISSVLFYVLSTRYIEDPQIAALCIIILALVLLVIAFIITRSFERLAEAIRLKSEFVGIVSHQLRSPLSNLKWALEFLMSGRVGHIGKEQAEYFHILKENSNRMQELVNDLLLVSRIEQGKMPLAKQEFSFKTLLDNILLEFEPLIKASNIRIEVQECKEDIKTFSDETRISHAISNLLDNAIRYSQKGSGAVLKDENKESVIHIKVEKKNYGMRFEIEDNGVGIPREDQHHIFQKFFRSANALRHETQGSGLGLYIAKSIIEKSGGQIGFSSKENKGSIFWFTIPLSTSA